VIRSRRQAALFVLTGLASLAALPRHGHLGTCSRYISDDFCSSGMAHRRRRGHHFLA
jgi:hypothetical protein